MVQSRCGLRCQECEYRESMNCRGCLQIEKPFWGESCPVKSCCEGREPVSYTHLRTKSPTLAACFRQ